MKLLHSVGQRSNLFMCGCLVSTALLQSQILPTYLHGEKRSTLLLSILIAGALACQVIVTDETILHSDQFQPWRTIMKHRISAWFSILACSICFFALMVVVCKSAETVFDAVIVVAASLGIFIPNMWALPKVLYSNIKKKD